MQRSLCKNSFDAPPIWSCQTLQNRLSLLANIPVILKLTQNRSTYMRIGKKTQKSIHLSIQEFFLHAPDDVCSSLANFLLFHKPQDKKILHRFATACFQKIDLSAYRDQESLWYQGHYYDLKKILEEINGIYFQGSIQNLAICYFPEPRYTTCRSVTWGVYDRSARLIRINSLLDHPSVPSFVIEFIIYHEMLHHVCPPILSNLKRNVFHSTRFKQLEKAFSHYLEAKGWEKQFFKNYHKKLRTNYVRS